MPKISPVMGVFLYSNIARKYVGNTTDHVIVDTHTGGGCRHKPMTHEQFNRPLDPSWWLVCRGL